VIARSAVVALVVGALSGCGANPAVVRDGANRPATASAGGDQRIVPKRGIAGVRLKMTRSDVVKLLGEPDAVGPSELHGGWTKLVFRAEGLRVTLDERGTVWNVRTLSRRHRGLGGTGVGSTEAALGKAMPKLECRAYGGPARYRHWRSCVDTSRYQGPFTDYTLVNGRVTRVTVTVGLAR